MARDYFCGNCGAPMPADPEAGCQTCAQLTALREENARLESERDAYKRECGQWSENAKDAFSSDRLIELEKTKDARDQAEQEAARLREALQLIYPEWLSYVKKAASRLDGMPVLTLDEQYAQDKVCAALAQRGEGDGDGS